MFVNAKVYGQKFAELYHSSNVPDTHVDCDWRVEERMNEQVKLATTLGHSTCVIIIQGFYVML